jgi:hypothetical protein
MRFGPVLQLHFVRKPWQAGDRDYLCSLVFQARNDIFALSSFFIGREVNGCWHLFSAISISSPASVAPISK